MEKKNDFMKIPQEFTVCVHDRCPRSETCLRRVAERELPASVVAPKIIRLSLLVGAEEDCPYFRPCRKAVYAKGFIRMLDALPHRQSLQVTSYLVDHFGRRTYYRARKGERLLSPAEQEVFRAILKRCGVALPQEFDTQYETYDWEDGENGRL